jgi:hypothetical protein
MSTHFRLKVKWTRNFPHSTGVVWSEIFVFGSGFVTISDSTWLQIRHLDAQLNLYFPHRSPDPLQKIRYIGNYLLFKIIKSQVVWNGTTYLFRIWIEGFITRIRTCRSDPDLHTAIRYFWTFLLYLITPAWRRERSLQPARSNYRSSHNKKM